METPDWQKQGEVTNSKQKLPLFLQSVVPLLRLILNSVLVAFSFIHWCENSNGIGKPASDETDISDCVLTLFAGPNNT